MTNASVSYASSESGGIRNVFRLASAPVGAKGLITPAYPRNSKLYFVSGMAASTYPVYLHLYDAFVSPTVGTTVPKITLPFSGLDYWNGTAAVASLSPNYYPFMDVGIDFLTGIAYAVTTGAADTDSGAIIAGDLVALAIGWM